MLISYTCYLGKNLLTDYSPICYVMVFLKLYKSPELF